jgi:hypothetical protein
MFDKTGAPPRSEGRFSLLKKKCEKFFKKFAIIKNVFIFAPVKRKTS